MKCRLRFQCLSEPQVIRTVIASSCTIGRALASDVILNDMTVSRRHAHLYQYGGMMHIEDLKSTNGVLVNGIPLQNSAISSGDIVLLGNYVMTLEPVDTVREEIDLVGSVASVSSVTAPKWGAAALALFRQYMLRRKQLGKELRTALELEVIRDVKAAGELASKFNVYPTQIQ